MKPETVLVLGSALALSGLICLAVAVSLLAAGLGALTLAIYLLVYTPLKTVTPLNTLVWCFLGALPPLLGWAASRGQITGGDCPCSSPVLLATSALPGHRVDSQGRICPGRLSPCSPWSTLRGPHSSSGVRTHPGSPDREPGSLCGRFDRPVYLGGTLVLGLAFLCLAGRFASRRSRGRAGRCSSGRSFISRWFWPDGDRQGGLLRA